MNTLVRAVGAEAPTQSVYTGGLEVPNQAHEFANLGRIYFTRHSMMPNSRQIVSLVILIAAGGPAAPPL